MANFNISDLDPVPLIDDSILIELLYLGVNYRGTIGELKTAFGIPSSGVTISLQPPVSLATQFPANSKRGYLYPVSVAGMTAQGDGGVIVVNALILSLVDNASTSSNTDWYVINTQ